MLAVYILYPVEALDKQAAVHHQQVVPRKEQVEGHNQQAEGHNQQVERRKQPVLIPVHLGNSHLGPEGNRSPDWNKPGKIVPLRCLQLFQL
jgi:hypothetical protein